MMIRLYIALLTVLILLSACKEEKRMPHVNEQVIFDSLDILMEQQQLTWNSGDIDGFMGYYWKSDSLSFIGKSGITRGWQATLDNYKKSYDSRAKMGRLDFTNMDHQLIGNEDVLINGKWELFRLKDTIGGYYTLHWKRKAGQWLIIADHTS
jgi:hypothetical protein